MIKKRWQSFGTLRFRLIGWYVVLLVLSLIVVSVYFYFQLRELQQNQQDSILQTAAAGVQGRLLDPGGRPGEAGGRPGDPGRGNSPGPVLRRGPGNDLVINDLLRRNIQLRLYDRDKRLIDSLGGSVAEMPVAELTNRPDFATLGSADAGQWRVYVQPLLERGGVVGWLQLGQVVFALDPEISRLFTPILLGTLMALVLAVLGGLFLANRALRPIDRVTRTASSISTQDLTRRINYHGPPDEIGRLAHTLDLMLDRLENGFEQERRFTSDASHELRTPLTALKGRLEVTLSRPRTDEEYRQTLADLSQEVDRLVRLSSSLLYLARLDQAGQHWQSEILNLSDLLDSIADSMQPVAELKDVTLRWDIPPGLHLAGNLDQLTRLFLNLLDNALKYTPAGGQVTLRAEASEKLKKVSVSVRDTGPGIAAEHLPHLFERFYRAQSDRASGTGGAGLGLAIASEIARQHSGRLEVVSQPGQGTALLVELPLSRAARP